MSTTTADSAPLPEHSSETIDMELPHLRKEFISSEPTTLIMQQKHFHWFKNTGRGFSITDKEKSTDDDAPLFAVESHVQGKLRMINDHEGQHLFLLERNFLSKGNGWVLKIGESEALLTARYSWVRPHINDITFRPKGSKEPSLTVVGKDFWMENAEIVSLSDKKVVATMQCTNMKSGVLSAFKVSPPVWEIYITAGTDVSMIVAIAVCVSDAFSESHYLMT